MAGLAEHGDHALDSVCTVIPPSEGQNQYPIFPAIDAEKIDTRLTDLLTVTLPNKPGPHKPQKKMEVNAAA